MGPAGRPGRAGPPTGSTARTAAALRRGSSAPPRWAAAEFERIGARQRGAGAARRRPASCSTRTARDPALREPVRRPGRGAAGALQPARRRRSGPSVALDALAALRAAGVPAVLVVAGRRAAARRGCSARGRAGCRCASRLRHRPRPRWPALLATADVVLAPGPVETFGLAALEALACGTPVVVNAASALPEVIGPAGLAADGTGGRSPAAVVRSCWTRRRQAERRAGPRRGPRSSAGPRRLPGSSAAHGVEPGHAQSDVTAVP